MSRVHELGSQPIRRSDVLAAAPECGDYSTSPIELKRVCIVPLIQSRVAIATSAIAARMSAYSARP
jgi:hypothetical protein